MVVASSARASAAAAELWQRQLDRNAAEMARNPRDSCSVVGNPMAERFAAWVGPRLRGRVLDLGCGPMPVPLYLHGYPLSRVTGLDPLDGAHPFRFVRGVAEDLPFDAASFDAAVSATTFDHLLDPERALAELRRVLAPGGRLLAWMTYWPDAPRYDPTAAAVAMPDDFHVYHLGRAWFEPLVAAAGFAAVEADDHADPYPSTFAVWEAV